MDLFNLLWNVRQERRINDVQDRAGATRASTSVTNAELRDDIERLTLITRAMWELLSEQSGVTEADLMARVQEVDLRDGVADNRLAPVPRDCTRCGRPNTPSRTKCIYCGEKLAVTDAHGALGL
jgi:hypothetical protein